MDKGATLTLSLPCNANKKLPMLLERNDNGGVLHNGMSLFQDLKLKRRKVDSRCSSDGESIGTSESASSLSPDAQPQGEGSPKTDKERCLTPEDLAPPSQVSKANGFPSQFYFMMKGDSNNSNNNNYDKTPNGLKAVTTTANVVVVKSEPGEDSSPSSSPGLEDQSRKGSNKSNNLYKNAKSPEHLNMIPNGKLRNGSVTKGHCSDNESVGSVKSERHYANGNEEKPDYEAARNGPLSLSSSSPRSLLSSASSPGSRNSPPRSQSNLPSCSPRRSPPQSMREAPSLIISKGKGGSESYSQRASPMSHHSGSSRGSSPPHIMNLNSHQNNHLPPHMAILNGQGPPGLFHATQLHARLTENRKERDMSPSNNNGSLDPPLSVVTSTSLSFHHGSMYRINGVRPEVISGGAVTPSGSSPSPGGMGSPSHHLAPHSQLLPNGNRKSPNSHMSRSPNSSPTNSSSSGSVQHSPGNISISTGGGTIIAGGSIGLMNQGSGAANNGTHNTNLSRTPTVIMGETGGVRTMLWSQPGQSISNPPLELGIGGSSPPGSSGSPSSAGGGGSSNSSYNGSSNSSHPAMQKGVLSMERLWATEALNLSTGASNTTNGHGSSITNLINGCPNTEDDEYEQPMICMICEDRATGLHYGIITCEGCKGFFKRTVQNRRVYTCVADGTCEITKAQRNRCQYCRFKKCIEQGMVLQAVREDRMPGGRNSGAVYNLYKVPVKYRKHKKGNRGAGKGDKSSTPNGGGNSSENGPVPLNNSNSSSNGSSNGGSSNSNSGISSMLPPHPGNILMAALTSPTENLSRRHNMPFDQAANMINALVQCDNFHDIAALHNWEELLEARGDLSDKLCQMGDSIVYRLVQWTKRLPFYSELPVEVHTRVLTHKWHELLVLTTSAWHAMHSPAPPPGLTVEEETLENLQILQRCLQAMMGRSLTLEQLKQDVGLMVERLTHLTRTFRRLGIRLEEYVSLKVITMLQHTGTKANEVTQIQERYIKVLRTFLEMTVPSQPNRLTDLLRCLPEVQAAASLLLESKMFYVPFLLNSALLQR